MRGDSYTSCLWNWVIRWAFPQPRAIAPDSPLAWLVVFAAFLSMFTFSAVAYSFGAFVNPITNEFHASRAAVSAVFSVTAFIYFLLGCVTGLLADRFGPRPVVVAGALLMGAGLALTSRIHDLSMSYLTYAIGVGAGVACGYVPMVAAVSGWFIQRRNTALGIAVAGIGFGTIVGAPLAAVLIALYGWRATYLLFSASSTFLLLLIAVFAHKPPASRITSGTTTGEALRTPAFAVLWVSSLLCSVPLFVPFCFSARVCARFGNQFGCERRVGELYRRGKRVWAPRLGRARGPAACDPSLSAVLRVAGV